MDPNSAWILVVLGAAAASLMLVAIWAGLARRPAWYWRGAVLFGAIGVLFPIEAYEPAALFLVSMPITALATLALRSFIRPPCDGVEKVSDTPFNVRFSLGELLLAVLLLAVACAIFSFLLRTGAFNEWSSLLAEAAALSAVSVALVAMTLPGRLWWKTLVLLLAIASSMAPAFLNDPLGINDYGTEPKTRATYWIGVMFVWEFLMAGLFTLGWMARRRAGIEASWDRSVRLAARNALILFGLLLVPPLLFIYLQLLYGVPFPPDSFPAENSLPMVLELAEKAEAYAHTVIEEENLPNQEHVAELRQLFDEMHTALEQDGHVVLPHTHNGRADFWAHIDGQIHSNLLHNLDSRWQIEWRAAMTAKRFDPAAEYAVATVRLGNYRGRGGLLIDALTGIALEKSGVRELALIRRNLSLPAAQSVLIRLERVDRSHEVADVTLARERAMLDRAFTWRRRLEATICRLRGQRDLTVSDHSIRIATAKRDARLRLLMTELAIRLFQDRESRLPNSLVELTPDFLSDMPVDPFSGSPLVYRREGKGYVLYSAGTDGVDNGGKFMKVTRERNELGFDIDADAVLR